jgi:polyketide synthase PksN
MKAEVFTLAADDPILAEHRLNGRPLWPGLAYIDFIHQLGRDWGWNHCELTLRNLAIHEPLSLLDDTTIAISVRPVALGENRWKLFVEHATEIAGAGPRRFMAVEVERTVAITALPDRLDLADLHGPAGDALDDTYQRLARLGLVHGEAMRAHGRICTAAAEASAVVALDLPEAMRANAADYMFHPTLLDGAGIASAHVLRDRLGLGDDLYLPLSFASFRACALVQGPCWVAVRSPRRQHTLLSATLDFFDEEGRKIAELAGVTCKRVAREAPSASSRPATTARPLPMAQPSRPAGELADLLRGIVATHLGLPKNEVDPRAGFYELGLDSRALLSIVDDLEKHLRRSLPPTLLFEFSCVLDLAAHLEAQPPATRHQERPTAEAAAAEASVASVIPVDAAATSARQFAIVGMAGRYPGAADVSELWTALVSGRNAITEVPADRWRWQDLVGIQSPSGKPMSRWGGFIADVDRFDARFFRITPREAEIMDPQERLFLEICWAAIEDAGYTPETLTDSGKAGGGNPVGVFAGVMQKDYLLLEAEALARGSHFPLSSNQSPIANRVSYVCDFHGPSLALDTACSSSLAAVHLALQSLAADECEVAIAGGVNLLLHPSKYLSCGLMDMHSSTGQCRPFGPGADGYVSAEGVGAVVIKPLEQAIRARDHIYAVIKGSVCNHGGKSSGLTVPNPVAQAALITACLRKTDVAPETISYVEAHGTGTSLGDPIEIEGLTRAFAEATSTRQFCAIGSVKSNIGHAEAAAGISALTKVALQLHHRTLVPSLNADEGNPKIDLERTPFFVQRTRAPWTCPPAARSERGLSRPRRAALSSFGASGTNVHMILEEAPPIAPDDGPAPAGPLVFPLSAATEPQLRAHARNIALALAATAATEAPGEVERTLVAIVANVLQISADEIDRDCELSELGIDPLALDALATQIRACFALAERPAALTPAATVAQLAAELAPLAPNGERAAAGPRLADVAYTLQVGRRALPERAAFVASDLGTLVSLLHDFAERGEAPGVERGTVDGKSVLRSEAPLGLAPVDQAAAWVRGVFTWQTNSTGATGTPPRALRRVSLPTYPFARDRHWIAATGAADPPAAIAVATGRPDDGRPVIERGHKELDEVIRQLSEALASVTKIPVSQLPANRAFEDLGLDSLMITELNQRLKAWCGVNDASLFFKYANIGDLARHLVTLAPRPAPETTVAAAPRTLPRIARGPNDIAIIGVAGRYPEADDLEQFWCNLCAGRDCIAEIPSSRWSWPDFFEPDRARAAATQRSYSRWGGFLSDVDRFDPMFFRITPNEAALMDPHERLFLEVAWHCIEDSGYTRAALAGSNPIGVFVGTTFNQYQLIMGEAAHRKREPFYPASSQIFSIANRVSYVMNFTGPSLTVDTACSSSLYAVHLACESIRSGESAAALVGGVNLSLHPSKYISLSLGQFLATDGRCRAFAEGGTGYVPGEAVGAVLLKPLDAAERDGDTIRAVIKGSGASHGGRTNGYSVPSPTAQAQAIERALATAEIDPRTVSFIEAHGTGTQLGDPIEIAGLTDAFRKHTPDTGFCAIGSVKTNIGHSEAAAGIAQLTKVILQLERQTLVPTLLHGSSLNPSIDFSTTPFFPQLHMAPWKAPTVDGQPRPRRAGISSFGAGGANAHVVLEEYASTAASGAPSGEQARPQIIVLSARTDEQLRLQAGALAARLRTLGDAPDALARVAYTLQVGREPMLTRLGFVARDLTEAGRVLQAIGNGERPQTVAFGYARTLPDAAAANDAARAAAAAALREWPQPGDENALPTLWVTGAAVDWIACHGGNPPRRISLPGHIFERESYWVPGVTPGSAGPAVSPALEEPVAASVNGPGVPAKASSVLVLAPTRDRRAPATDGPDYRKRVVVLCDPPEAALLSWPAGHEVERLTSGAAAADQRFTDLAVALLAIVQRQLTESAPGKILLQVFGLTTTPGLVGLAALLKTARLENPKLVAQWIGLDAWPTAARLGEMARETGASPGDSATEYVRGEPWISRWQEPAAAAAIPAWWRDGGCYLISGGAGGLGGLLARAIADRVPGARLLLTGRSAPGPAQRDLLEILQSRGAKAEYRAIDVADATATSDLVRDWLDRQGALHGIFHCAGVLRDNFIVRKSADELRQVLAPKVSGLVNLDHATKDLPLDFLVCFSSGAAAVGNPGQADYAAANAFMDDFVVARERLRRAGARHGRSLSINWPLWRDGGMRIDDGTVAAVEQRTGLVPLSTADGLAAMGAALALDAQQVLVAAGDGARLRAALLANPAERAPLPAVPSQVSAASAGSEPGLSDDRLREKIDFRLRQVFSQATGIPSSRLVSDEPLESYGLDSVLISRLNQTLGEPFADLSKTIFFEHRTLDALAQHLVLEHREACLVWTGGQPGEAADAAASVPATTSAPGEDAPAAPSVGPTRPSPARPAREPIAIIGMSGRYPQAEDLAAFWANLRSGKDCITEIPSDRWPLEGFYTADRTRAVAEGKSYSKWGGFITGWDEFDPLFFNMSPLETLNLDPQARLFLQGCWATLEDAGYTRRLLAERHHKRVGVFAGVTKTGYNLYGPALWPRREGYNPQTSFASVANRVSYLLDLEGPSVPVDTMCSSSLTAVHQACEAISAGDCDLALAGGVNLYLHPINYLELSGVQMLSSQGQCRSFGAGADGFVPGEGVGVVLLKRLTAALADGDNIHAVIRATGTNHGGKVNGFTVPNPGAQRDLIGATLAKAQVHARAVSCVEAHGTGTELGDPIEVTGLSQAFAPWTKDVAYCALGSAKSNVGHLEAAAGIAGLTKIVLQLAHGELVPTLHAETSNPNIPFEKTPFVLQKQAGPWLRPVLDLGDGPREYPRIAALSSFGAGGANAHAIIQELDPHLAKDFGAAAAAATSVRPAEMPVVIVLSAKSEEQVATRAADLLRAISQENFASSLEQVAFTLQDGREHMEVRLALVATSLPDLRDKLRRLGSGSAGLAHDPDEDIFISTVATRDDILALLGSDEDLAGVVRAWMAKGKHARLARLWVRGLEVPWRDLYAQPPRRISLPTYPFARESYRLPLPAPALDRPALAARAATTTAAAAAAPTSPSGHASVPIRLEGDEFFLRDHRVQGQKVLPAVAALELAFRALGQIRATSPIRRGRLRDVVWARPVVVGDAGLDLELDLQPIAEGDMRFELHGTATNGDRILHASGQVAATELPPIPPLPLQDLLRTCRPSRPVQDDYAAFAAMGLAYGPAHQALQKIHRGDRLVVAELALPGCVRDTAAAYSLHPSLFDGALQASIGLTSDTSATKPLLPFALDELQLLGPCPPRPFCVVELATQSEEQRRLDIKLCDEQGNVWASLTGFAARPLKADLTTTTQPLHLVPSWRPGARRPGPTRRFAQHRIFLGEPRALNFAQHPEIQVADLAPGAFPIDEHFAVAVVNLLASARSLLEQRPTPETLIQIVVPDAGPTALLSGLSGLLKTLTMENPKIRGQIIRVPSGTSDAQLATWLLEDRTSVEDTVIRYRDGRREVATWQAWPPPSDGRSLAWKDGGVYVLTGGLGGLGLLFAEDLARNARDATLLLLGRSALDNERERRMRRLMALGARVEYHRIDCTDARAVDSLVHTTVARFGRINGILHSAGVLRDSFVLKKSAAECRDVLAPKVQALLCLDGATQALPLDFFVLFSSVAGALGNPGQADYAAANAFMDEFAHHRNGLVAAAERNGTTLSINWPLWRDGGMHVGAENEELLRRNTGMRPLSTKHGLRAFHDGVVAGLGQLLVIEGDTAILRAALLAPARVAEALPVLVDTLTEVRQAVADVLGVDLEQIDAQTPLAEFGLDALQLEALAARLRSSFTQDRALPALTGTATAGSLAEDLARSPSVSGETSQSNGAAHRPEPERLDSASLMVPALAYLREQMAHVIKLPPNRIGPDVAFEKYGIDSVLVMQLTTHLEKTFGPLSKTLFFEYQTLRALTDYFVEAFPTRLAEITGLDTTPVSAPGPAQASEAVSVPPIVTPRPPTAAPRAEAAATPSHDSRDIAIIGVAGRYPMAPDLETFWNNLQSGKDCISEIPPSRWNHSALYHPEKGQPGKVYTRWGGFLDDVKCFDHVLFNISPREAQIMDPQERLFMECAHAALEDAGHTRQSLAQDGNVGVYVGVMYEEYQFFGVERSLGGMPLALSGNPASIANRVSYFCNFHGPSVAIDTMCSSSLTAIHLACQSLALGECEAALAGGVNLSLHPNKYLMLSQARFASSKGRCESFGEGGDGYVPGEGVGAVLLKPLHKAIADGDQVYAVIKATAVNHGGKTNGYTVPNPTAQSQVITRALAQAKVDPSSISYVEAHGTGTSLGDPIEVAALVKAFGLQSAGATCAIGSVKSNIGHCESAAGIAALTKVILQLRHGQLVPSLHAEPANPNIDFGPALRVQKTLAPWTRPVRRDADGRSIELPRRAGISSFGAGGSNAHLILEEPPRKRADHGPADPGQFVIVLSAKKPDRLAARIAQLHEALERDDVADQDLASIAFTLQTGREPMEERLAIVCTTRADLIARLRQAEVEPAGDGVSIFRGRATDEFRSAIPAVGDALTQARAWVEGHEVDWAGSYLQRPVRLRLPTYPFARTPHWVPEPPRGSTAPLGSASTSVSTPQDAAATALPHRPAFTAPPIVSLSAPALSPPGPRPLDLPKPRQGIRLAQIGAPAAVPAPGPIGATSNRPAAVVSGPAPASTRPPRVPPLALGPVKQRLAARLAEALFMNVDELDDGKPFVEFGLDSITGVEWVKAVGTDLGVSLPTTKIYDHPTLDQFARYVTEQLAARALPDDPAEEVRSAGGDLPSVVAGPAAATAAATAQHAPSLPDLAQLQQELAATLAEALLLAEADISADATFAELGLDSIIGVEWIQALNRRYGTDVKATQVYDHPTLATFTRFFGGKLFAAESLTIPDPVTSPRPTSDEGDQDLQVLQVLQRVFDGGMGQEQAAAVLADLSL